MKKLALLSGLAVAVAGGAAAVPFYVGNQAEALVFEPLFYERGQVLLAHSGEKFERGYLASQAETKLSLAVEDELVELAVAHDITHVFAPRFVSRFRVLPGGGELQQALFNFFGDDPVLIAETQMTLRGSRTELTMPEVDRVLTNESGRFHFAGMDGAFTIDNAALAGSIDVRPIALTGEEHSLHIRDQQLVVNIADIHELISTGDSTYTLQGVELNYSEDEYVLGDLRIHSSQAVAAMNVDGNMLLELASLETPHSTLEDLSFQLSFTSLHREFMEYLAEFEMKSEGELAAAALAPEAFQPMVLRFLENTPAAKLKFQIGPSTDSMLTATWDLMFRQTEGVPVSLDRPMELMAGVDTTAVLTFKPEFIDELAALTAGALGTPDEIRATLTTLEEEGFMMRDEQGYRAKLSFREGNFLVNDAPHMGLAMMLSMLLLQ